MHKTLFLLFLIVSIPFEAVKAENDTAILPSSKPIQTQQKKTEEGFDLKSLIHKDAKPVFKPNIHSIFECSSCHVGEAKIIREKKGAPDFITGDDEIKLCATCHSRKECFHPVGSDILDTQPPMNVPKHLPLGKGTYSGKVVCSTCHQIHMVFTIDQILRGFPELPDQKNVIYKNRLELCFDCHKDVPDDYDKPVSIIKHIHEAKTPDNTKNTQACQFCHIENPEDVKNISNPRLKKIFIENNFRAPINQICRYCHNEKREKIHYAESNAFADLKYEKDIESLDLPLINGKFTCVTCHDQHNKSKDKYYLRGQYIRFTEQSKRIKPHKKIGFCLSCHETDPTKEGEKVTYRFNGDWNQICNWCHKSGEARAQVHPVNIPLKEAKGMMKPKDFPLTSDDKITCLTCHYGGNYGCMENTIYNVEKQVEEEGNEKRLRGWPYPGETPEEKRWQQCIKCHVQEHIAKFNVHYQIDSTTDKIIEASCLFCHSSLPNEKVEGIQKVEFKAPVLFLCLCCHRERKHPGTTPKKPDGVNHIVVPKDVPGELIIPKDLPETDRNMIHCATCHNPHQEGLIGGRRGLIGGTERKRFKECTTCHIGKF